MRRRKYLQNVSVVAGSVAIAGCSSGSDNNDSQKDDNNDNAQSGDDTDNAQNEDESDVATTEQEQPSGTKWYDSNTKIGILDGVETELDSIGSLYIRGAAQNFGDTDYEYVQLEFEVYDDTDAKIADGLANTSGLSSDQKWRFEALAASAENADSYKLSDITAY